MTDRELLELAALAAGFIDDQTSESDAKGLHRNGQGVFYVVHAHGWHNWAPLTDDGDALRLAVELRLHINIETYGSSARRQGQDWCGCEAHLHGGLAAATRRAIVRAAAEIGKAMQQEHRRTTP